jgi:hypothetical protein
MSGHLMAADAPANAGIFLRRRYPKVLGCAL